MASNASRLIPLGVLFVQILVEGKTPADVANKANLNSWISRVSLPYTSTLDTVDPSPLEIFFGVPRDQFILVDLKTMAVLDIIDANPQAAVAEVEQLLGLSTDGGAGD